MLFYSVDKNNVLNGLVDYLRDYRIFKNLIGWIWMSLYDLVFKVVKLYDVFSFFIFDGVSNFVRFKCL